MKICPNCGQELKQGDEYCLSCGHEVIYDIKQEAKSKRKFKQKLLIALGIILIFISLYLFPIIGPLAIE